MAQGKLQLKLKEIYTIHMYVQRKSKPQTDNRQTSAGVVNQSPKSEMHFFLLKIKKTNTVVCPRSTKI